MAHSAPSVFTLLGWSPRTTDCLSSATLPCGCVVGQYETREWVTLTVLDAVAASCTDQTHRPDAVLEVRPVRGLHRPGTPETAVGAGDR